MFLSSWINGLQNRLNQNRRLRNKSLPRRQNIQNLEQRTLLTTTGVLVGTELSVFADDGDDIIVQVDATTGSVVVLANGMTATGVPSVAANSLTGLNIIAGNDDNAIDVSAVAATDFTLLAVDGSIRIEGGDGNDSITGSADFGESIFGQDGNDTIDGGDGNDTIDGGNGNDMLTGGVGADSIDGDDGADTIVGGSENDVIMGGDGPDSITGDAGTDNIDAGQGADFVDAGDDNDTINGMAGNDTIIGGLGNDSVLGGSQQDSIIGGDGDDTLDGQGGSDTIDGADGADSLIGGQNGDSITGGAGNDTLNGMSGNDSISGGDDADRIFGGGGRDSLEGKDGDDTLPGQGGDDTLVGGSGDDVLRGGGGNDLLQSLVPQLSVSDIVVVEGDSGTTAAVFTLQLLSPSASVVSVDFATLDGTATTADGDYAATMGRVVFAPLQTQQTVNVTVFGDTDVETDETFLLNLTNPTGATLLTPQVTGIIADDDTPPGLIPGPNVNVSQIPFNQAEVTIAVNPTNPLNLIAGSNDLTMFPVQDDVTWFSLDGGQTWTLSLIPNTPGANPGGDPTIVFDRTGVAYFSHLNRAANNLLSVARSTDGGQTWTAVDVTAEPAPVLGFVDKEFLAVGPDFADPTRDRIYLAYHADFVQFIQSSTDGITWSAPVPVQVGGSGINAQPAVGPNGEVYMAWQETVSPGPLGFSRIFFDVSLDGGLTWGTDQIAYTTTVPTVDLIFGVAPIFRYTIPAAPVRGMGAFLALDVDRSGGPNNGTIYMLILDQGDLDDDPNTNHDDTDVFVIRSTDGGASWSAPVRVNDDTTSSSQFVPWLDVDQITGDVAVGWYDARNDAGLGGPGDTNGIPNDDVQYFVSVSQDGGQTFLPNVQVSAGASNAVAANAAPSQFAPFDYGEYTGIAAHNGVVYALWSDNSNSTGDNPAGTLVTQDVYFAAVTFASSTPPTVPGPGGGVEPGNDTLNGDGGNDTILAAGGDDSVNGGDGNDRIATGAGDDTILGGSGRDTVDGGEGNDTIDGQGGDDVIQTGLGQDLVIWNGSGDGVDTIEESAGAQALMVIGDGGADSFSIDSILGLLRVAEGTASITVSNSTNEVTILGGNGDDSITVSSIDDVRQVSLLINGQGNNDTITAANARLGGVLLDLRGGSGNDTITGSRDRETISGNAGDDSLSGGESSDIINGGAGNDVLNGDLGDDSLDGGTGNDTLNGNDGNDSLQGSFGNDVLMGDVGNDTLRGGFGNDILNGAAGNDLADGNQDNDRVLGGAGDDSLDGGTGDDTVTGQAGNDQIKGGDGNDRIEGNSGSDTIDGGDGDDTIDGGNGRDMIDAGDGNDSVNGMAGRDTLIGGDGNDTLLGGGGVDRIFGGDGTDTLRGNGSIDKFNSGEGGQTPKDLGVGETDDQNLTIELSVLAALAELNGF